MASYNVCDPCRARKVRCGRERPNCANCDRSGQDCTWNGHGRKTTQSTTLFVKHAVARIGDQLERLEQNVFKINSSLQRLHNSPDNVGNNQSNISLGPTRPSRTCPSTLYDVAHFVPDENASQETLRHGVGRRAFSLVEGAEMYCGPTSLHCLILDAQEFILAPMARGRVIQKHESAIFNARLEHLLAPRLHTAGIDDGDDVLPAMPPTAMFEAMIEPYFEQINPTFPLWTRAGLRAQVAAYQPGHTACAVSASNMILLTLTAKFSQAVSQRPLDLSSEQTFSCMESELAGPFTTNARRAARNTDRLLTPNLANIQALLSLCLVAPYCLPEGHLYRIFHQALYLSQVIGLSGEDSHTSSHWQLQERRNVFRCLCVLSTSISWMTGIYTGVLIHDTLISRLSNDTINSPDELSNWDARIEMARIEEQVFKRLFAPSQALKRPDRVCTCAMELLVDLDHWCEIYHTKLVDQHEGPQEQPDRHPGSGFTVKHQSLRAILLHADQGNRESSQGSTEAAQDLIRGVIRGWQTGSDLGHYTDLTSDLISCTSAAIVQLLSEVQEVGPGQSSPGKPPTDLDLLRSLQSIFKAIVTLVHKDSYFTRLATFIDVLLDLAAASQACPSPEPPVLSSGLTPDSVDAIFSGLPDFLRDASYPSSSHQSANPYTFPNHASQLPRGIGGGFTMEEVEGKIESYLALETGAYGGAEEVRVDSW